MDFYFHDTPILLIMALPLGAFVIAFFSYPPYIAWLKSKLVVQHIREEGPKSHVSKNRTVTMGGLIFIGATIVSTIFALFFPIGVIKESLPVALLVLATAILCGLIGFMDDFGKVTSKSNIGISGKTRLILEFAIGILFVIALHYYKIPVSSLIYGLHINPELKVETLKFTLTGFWQIAYIFLLVPFIIAATTNALNLHDGMDGLAAGTSFLVFITLCLMLIYIRQFSLACLAASVAGALVAFLIYNCHPAKIFMGDTGSLFLGGLMAALVVSCGLTFFFLPLSLIYIIETLSVIAQVTYFKLTKPYVPDKPVSRLLLVWMKLTKRLPGQGKRLFHMSPIHHHFEIIACNHNMSEKQVVLLFWLAQFALCAIVLFAFSMIGCCL